MATELATAYISLVPSARGFSQGIQGELSGAGRAAARDTESSFGGAAGGIGATFKTALIGAGTAAIGVGAAGAAGLFKIGSDFDSAFDAIRVGTGATGDALAALQDDMKSVLKEVPASIGDTGQAIADLNTRLGLSGEPLQELTAQFLNLSRITGTDVTTNVDKITRAFGDWNIGAEYMPETMDHIFRASQASGIGVTELSDSLVQFGAPLRNLGFTMNDAMAMLAQFNKTGVNTSTVFAGLKAGVGKLAKAGEDVPATFRRVVGEIEALGPGSEATAKAIELFGQRAGPDLADAIAGGKFELDGMLESIRFGDDTIQKASDDTESFGEKWTVLKNRVLVGLEPIATRLFTAVGDGMERLVPFIQQQAPKFQAFLEGLRPTMEQIAAVVRDKWPAIQQTVTEVFETIRVVVEEAIMTVQKLWNDWGDEIMAVVEFVFPVLLSMWQNAWDAVAGIVRTVLAVLRGDWDGAWDGIKQAFGGVTGFFKDQFDAMIVGITNAAEIGFAWLVEHIKGLPSKIKTAAEGMFDGLKDAFKAAMNWIIEKWNDLEFTLPEVDTRIPGVGKVGGFTLGTPDIPKLHDGGIYRAPTPGGEGLALLRDGERVITPEQNRRRLRRHMDGAITIIAAGAPAREVSDELMWSTR
jgi:TP901 family phage tail tape measure protein